MTRAIKVKHTEDIQKISGMVDAKSLLGMFLLSLNEPLQLVVEDDIDASALLKDLSEYLDIEE